MNSQKAYSKQCGVDKSRILNWNMSGHQRKYFVVRQNVKQGTEQQCIDQVVPLVRVHCLLRR